MAAKIEYHDLVQLNNWIRKNADTWYFHCTTRTVQESKLFPVPPYMVLSYLQAYYRYPEMFRKLAEVNHAGGARRPSARGQHQGQHHQLVVYPGVLPRGSADSYRLRLPQAD